MKRQTKIDLLWIGWILFLLILFFSIPTDLFSQEKPDSTLFKKYSADIKTLQEAAQKLEKDKSEFLGKYFESMQNIQNQFQVVDMYLKQERERLAKVAIEKKKK